MGTDIQTVVSLGLIVFMLGAIAVNEVVLRRKVRVYKERKRKRDLEDTLQLLGLGKRKTDR